MELRDLKHKKLSRFIDEFEFIKTVAKRIKFTPEQFVMCIEFYRFHKSDLIHYYGNTIYFDKSNLQNNAKVPDQKYFKQSVTNFYVQKFLKELERQQN